MLKIDNPQSWTKFEAHPSRPMAKGIFWQFINFSSYYRASLIYQVSNWLDIYLKVYLTLSKKKWLSASANAQPLYL